MGGDAGVVATAHGESTKEWQWARTEGQYSGTEVRMTETVTATQARILGSLDTQPTHSVPGIMHLTEVG